MDYIELSLPRPSDDQQAEILIALLADLGFEGFAEEENTILAYIPEKEFDRKKLDTFVAGSSLFEKTDVSVKHIADRNWNEAWESNYPAVWIEGRCYIRAPFHDPEPGAEYEILIKPKMAFGTAHHETTSLMIKMLLDMDVKGDRVLDMGCGTGILAILAYKKGAEKIVAIDNDDWAYRNVIENTGLNGASSIEIRMGDSSALKPDDRFDLILANINKNILLRDMDKYVETLAPKGRILFSGFFEEDLDDIKDRAKNCGLVFVSNDVKNRWTAAGFVKQ
ncbi:MAG: 50S ribosomal protein L11 methyltransferase [Chlorobi bacterium]|nr:50S ribosomal protein L11 methyltransferase [Chlorobiota bacterium]